MSDLDGRCFRRVGDHLVPVDFAAEEFVRELPEGKEIMITVRRPRSPDHHRWFFAMLRKVVENSERWTSEDDLLTELKLSVGHCDQSMNLLTGEVHLVPRSINFASMDQLAFKRFTKRCAFVLASALGIDVETLMAETQATQPPKIRRAA